MNKLRTLLTLALATFMCCTQASAQEASKTRSVPFRLTSQSGEAVEMRLHFLNDYSAVESVSFDITVRKEDGDHQYVFKAREGSDVLVTLSVVSNKVMAFAIDTDYRPAQADEASTTLTLASRSGEGLYFIYEWSGMALTNVRVDSERTSTRN